MGGLRILDAIVNVAAALIFMVFAFMAIGKSAPFMPLLAMACLMMTVYFVLAAIDAAFGGQ